MRRRWLRLLCLVPLLACAPAHAQPASAPAPEVQALFVRALATTCVGDAASDLRAALLAHRAALAPAFRRAFVDGPPADQVVAVRIAADRRYAALAQFPLAQYRIEGIAREDLARFARPSRRSYVDDEVLRYVTGYRANALAALGVVGTAQDRALLARTARDGGPLAVAAAEALKEMPAPR